MQSETIIIILLVTHQRKGYMQDEHAKVKYAIIYISASWSFSSIGNHLKLYLCNGQIGRLHCLLDLCNSQISRLHHLLYLSNRQIRRLHHLLYLCKRRRLHRLLQVISDPIASTCDLRDPDEKIAIGRTNTEDPTNTQSKTYTWYSLILFWNIQFE